MDPATITLIITFLDLLVKVEPGIVALVQEIRALIAKNPDSQRTLKQITDGTIQVSQATREQLAPLLALLQEN